MARIGDEVGAHLLDPPQWREIVERKQQEAGPGIGAGRQDRGHDGLVPTVERHALEEFGALGCAARARVADRLQHFRDAQPERDRLARTQRGCDRGGARGSALGRNAGVVSALAVAISTAAAMSAKPASAGPAAIAPSSHKAPNASAVAASTKRVRLSP